jgi:hypothetical protein
LVAFKTWFERVKGADTVPVPDVGHVKAQQSAFGAVNGFSVRYDVLCREIERVEGARAQVLEEAERVQAEWDALGVCPTCTQPCSHLAVSLEAV